MAAGRTSTSESTQFRRLAGDDELRRIRPGEGLLLFGHLAPSQAATPAVVRTNSAALRRK